MLASDVATLVTIAIQLSSHIKRTFNLDGVTSCPWRVRLDAARIVSLVILSNTFNALKKKKKLCYTCVTVYSGY